MGGGIIEEYSNRTLARGNMAGGGKYQGIVVGAPADASTSLPSAVATPQTGMSLDLSEVDQNGRKIAIAERVPATGQAAAVQLGKKLATDYLKKHFTRNDPGFDPNGTVTMTFEATGHNADGTGFDVKLQDTEKGRGADRKAGQAVNRMISSLIRP